MRKNRTRSRLPAVLRRGTALFLAMAAAWLLWLTADFGAAAKALGGSVKFVDAVRFEKGEGIEKKVDDFAAEVAAAAGLAK